MVFALVERLGFGKKATAAAVEPATELDTDTDKTDVVQTEAVVTEEQKKVTYPKIFKTYQGTYDAQVIQTSEHDLTVTLDYNLRKDGAKTATNTIKLSAENCDFNTLVALIRSGVGSQPVLTLGEAVFKENEGKTFGVISSNMNFLTLPQSLRAGN